VVGAAAPDLDGLRGPTRHLDRHRQPIGAAIESMNRARFVHDQLELIKFHSPSNQGDDRHAPANTPGIRHIAFAVEDIDAVVAGLRARGAELVGELERYEDSYRLCYVRGPEGIIIELAEQIGSIEEPVEGAQTVVRGFECQRE